MAEENQKERIEKLERTLWRAAPADDEMIEKIISSPFLYAKIRTRVEEAGLVCSGESPDGRLVEFIELPSHPFWVGTQAHPEFKSRPTRPHPLFRELIGAALTRAEGRAPHLPDLDAAVYEAR